MTTDPDSPDRHTIAGLSAWLDAAVAVVVTAAGLVGFAAVSWTQPLDSAIALVLIGVGAAVAALFVVAVGWNRPEQSCYVRPRCGWPPSRCGPTPSWWCRRRSTSAPSP